MLYAVHMKNDTTGESIVKVVEASSGFKAMQKTEIGSFYNSPWRWIGSEPASHIARVATKIGEDTYTVPEWYGIRCKM